MTRKLPSPDFYDAAPDWITLTYKPNSEVFQWAIENPLSVMRRALPGDAEGYKLRPWRFMGYAGYQLGPIRFGRRDDGAIWIVSGEHAGLPLHLPAVDDARCTRLDVRLDLFYAGTFPRMVSLAKRAAKAHKKALPGRPFVVDPREPDIGGHTLYLGSRSSPVFVRLYDKQAERDGEARWRGCWRLEVELKDGAQDEEFHKLYKLGFSREACTNLVLAYTQRRGLWFDGITSGGWEPAMVQALPPSDAEKKLSWLASQVQPTVRWLLQNVDDTAILDALGLMHLKRKDGN